MSRERNINLKMDLPNEELSSFLEKSDKITRKCVASSRSFLKIERYEEIKNSLEAILFNSSVEFYGSRIMGIANHYSDLDMFISFKHSSDGISRNKAKEKIFLLKNCMKSNPDWYVQHTWADASVPILRCVYIPNGLKCKKQLSQSTFVKNNI